jgi:Ser/Thr protein kinase RdoA (MazF antagonist)
VNEEVITSEALVSAEWLTGVLRSCGALVSGQVCDVRADFAGASWSKNGRLRLTYEEGSEGECPSRLFLKICAGADAVFGPSEVFYYTRDYVAHPAAPLPRCYAAAYREEPRAYHVLLEDLSATHQDGFRIEPTLEHGCAIGEALARLHAPYWGPKRLSALGAEPAGEAELERYFGWIEPGLEPLLEAMGGALEPSARGALEDVFADHRAAMLRRAGQGVGFTLVHGDPNPGNILTPRQGQGPVYLIDRQPFDWSLQSWLGASDLAILMVLHWDEAHRRALQYPVLRDYRASLEKCGIDFAWEQLLWDYRFSVAQCLEFAVEWCVLPADREGKRWLWERQLRRSLAAWFELECAEVLGG